MSPFDVQSIVMVTIMQHARVLCGHFRPVGSALSFMNDAILRDALGMM